MCTETWSRSHVWDRAPGHSRGVKWYTEEVLSSGIRVRGVSRPRGRVLRDSNCLGTTPVSVGPLPRSTGLRGVGGGPGTDCLGFVEDRDRFRTVPQSPLGLGLFVVAISADLGPVRRSKGSRLEYKDFSESSDSRHSTECPKSRRRSFPLPGPTPGTPLHPRVLGPWEGWWVGTGRSRESDTVRPG